jgi:hypothetical protein
MNLWENINRKDSFYESAHYQIFKGVDDKRNIDALKLLFPDAKANSMNFCLFSTSGIHGSYTTIEDVEKIIVNGEYYDEDGEEEDLGVTFLIVQPRLVCLRYGVCYSENIEDINFLKNLRASSYEAIRNIGN